MPKRYFKITYRDIAKAMASKLIHLDGEDYGQAVNDTLDSINRLPTWQKQALRIAYVFSCKVPKHERDDFWQDLILALLKAKTSEPKLAYAIARCDWQNWWQKWYSKNVQFCVYNSNAGDENPNCKGCKHETGKPCAWLAIRPIRTHLESVVSTDLQGNTATLGETLVGECEYEELDAKLDGEALLNKMPRQVRAIVIKRLTGDRLQKGDRHVLENWSSKNISLITSLTTATA